MKSIAFFDLDKTLYNTHSFFEIVKYNCDSGIIDPKTNDLCTEEVKLYRSGEQTYQQTANNLLKIYATALTGKDYAIVKQNTKEYFEQNKHKFFNFAAELVALLKPTHDLYLITTNTQMVGEVIVDMLGLDNYISTMFEVQNGKFTGIVVQSLADGKSLIQNVLNQYDTSKSCAFGDSENDVGMLELVKYPFCFNPNKELAAIAQERNWTVVDESNIFNSVKTQIH